MDTVHEGGHRPWPYLWLDAIYVPCREAGAAHSVALVTAVACSLSGCKRVIGTVGPRLPGPPPRAHRVGQDQQHLRADELRDQEGDQGGVGVPAVRLAPAPGGGGALQPERHAALGDQLHRPEDAGGRPQARSAARGARRG